MEASVTVITPTLPERSQLLERCARSVIKQTVFCLHEIFSDRIGEGPQALRNALAWSATTEWLLPLDDDDELDPTCVQMLLENSEDADIVYPWCRMEGRTDNWVPNKLFEPGALFKQNFIPVTALIRRDLFLMLGGYQKSAMEDWLFWQWAYLHGATFKCVPEVLWTYHHHEGQAFQGQAA